MGVWVPVPEPRTPNPEPLTPCFEVVRADGTSLDLGRVEVAPELEIASSPDPHPHWTIKECLEQPAAIARALGFGGRLGEDRIYLGGLDRNKVEEGGGGESACALAKLT